MPYHVGCDTNVGAVREQNQDSYIVRYTNSVKGDSCIAVLCDGMGGLSEGDLASNTVAKAFEKWYIERFENGKDGFHQSSENLIEEIKIVINYCHEKLLQYGHSRGIRLGTTLTLLLICNGLYLAMNIGDSRIYLLQEYFSQITKDDTVLNRMIEENRISIAEAKNSDKKHILTQCIGVGNSPVPHVYMGNCKKGDVLFLCCDGMYHELSDSEISEIMQKQRMEQGENSMSDLKTMIAQVIAKGERDNITGIFITIA